MTAHESCLNCEAPLGGLLFFLFLPAMAVALAYIIAATHRVYRGRWWATALRAALISGIGVVSAWVVITRGTRRG